MNGWLADSARVLSTLAIGLALAACGDGDGTAPALTAEGAYGGTLTNSTSNEFRMLILENGELWMLYGVRQVNGIGVQGFIQGGGTSDVGVFTSTNARDFASLPATDMTVSARYNSIAGTIAGTAVGGDTSVAFTGGPVVGSSYEYNQPATIASVAGVWSMANLDGEIIALNVAIDGTLTAVTNLGCSIRGTMQPRPSGKNVLDLTLRYGVAPCGLPGVTAAGIAVLYPLASGRMQLVIAAVDAARLVGTAAFGFR